MARATQLRRSGRMDYLLRDSLHLGVQYGKFDLDRIVATSTAIEMIPDGSDAIECRLAVTKGGLYAAVGLILARYFMFTQVYFHKTRVAYDILTTKQGEVHDGKHVA